MVLSTYVLDENLRSSIFLTQQKPGINAHLNYQIFLKEQKTKKKDKKYVSLSLLNPGLLCVGASHKI